MYLFNQIDNTMGQNQSTTFSNGADTSPSNQLPQWPPSPIPAAPHPSQALILPSVKLEDDCARPLPPPSTRAEVASQASTLAGWVPIDDEGDVMVATRVKKRKTIEDTRLANQPAPAPLGTSIQTSEDTHKADGQSSATNTSPLKKRWRLVITEQANNIMNGELRFKGDNMVASTGSKTNAEASNEQILDMYYANRTIELPRPASPASQDSIDSSFGSLEDDNLIFDADEKDASSFSSADNEEPLVKQLARLHQDSISRPENDLGGERSPTGKRLSFGDEVIEYAIARKEKEEEENAERSRLLRDRKHAMDSGDLFDEMDDLVIGSDAGNDSFDEMNQGKEVDFTHNSPQNPSSETSSEKPCYSHANEAHDSQLKWPRGSAQTDAGPSKAQSRDRQLSSDDDMDLEELLDISQEHNRPQSNASGEERLKRARSCQSINMPHSHNPYSRTAAEGWRTQDRHLEDSSAGTRQLIGPTFSLKEGEDRLRSLTQRLDRGRPTTVDYYQSRRTDPHTSKALPAPSLPSPPQENPMLNSGSSSPMSITDRSDDMVPSPIKKPHMTSLQLQALRNRRRDLNGTTASAAGEHSDHATPLGQARDVDLDDAQQIRDETERLRAQKKDLKAIKGVFERIALIRTVGELFEKEEEELNECRRYVSSVIDKKQPGKARRKRMHDIRDNMDGRIGRIDSSVLPPADDPKVQEFYEDILGKERSIAIEEALEIIDETIEELSVRRQRHQDDRKNAAKREMKAKQAKVKLSMKKKVRWEDLEDGSGRLRRDVPDGTEIDLDGPPAPKPKPKKLNKSEREMKTITERLKLFETGKPVNESGTGGHPNVGEADESGSESGESEAETANSPRTAGSAFTALKKFSRRERCEQLEPEQDIDEINRLEDQRQQDSAQAAGRVLIDSDAPHTRQSSQLFDPELLTQFRRKYADGAAPQPTQAAGPDDEELFDVWTDTDSTASSDSDSSDSDLNDTVHVYRYKVIGQFAGVDRYNDGDKISFLSFHNVDKANEHVQAIVSAVQRNFGPSLGDYLQLNTRRWEGRLEQMLIIGPKDEVQARVWVDRQLKEVNVGRLNASKALKRRLVGEKHIYQVTWEKTTTTTFTPAATAEGGTAQDDDLFGPEPAPAPTITTEVERCPDPVIHCDLASANRMAKEDFMLWYSQFFPEAERKQTQLGRKGTYVYNYSGFLRQVNDAHEEKLGMLGSAGLYEVEEEVVQSSSSDGAGVEAEGAKKAMKQKMKVYVEIKPVLGPAN